MQEQTNSTFMKFLYFTFIIYRIQSSYSYSEISVPSSYQLVPQFSHIARWWNYSMNLDFLGETTKLSIGFVSGEFESHELLYTHFSNVGTTP